MIGDEILKIDGMVKRNLQEISVELLKGQANTDLNLTIKRYGQANQFDILLKKEIAAYSFPCYGDR